LVSQLKAINQVKMDPPNYLPLYFDDESILLVNQSGILKKLSIPFRAQCISPVGSLKPKTWIYVEQVIAHHQYRILYRVLDQWIPYNFFKIVIYF